MSTVLAPPETDAPPDTGGGNDVFDPGPPGGGGGHWGGGGAFPVRCDPYRVAVWVLLVPVLTFFVGLTRALLAARNSSTNWVAVELPLLAYVNTAVLLGSSVVLEVGRNALRTGSRAATGWLWATTALGYVFMAGQAYLWRDLAGSGVAQPSNAARAFFYVLTMSHGAHLIGALGALTWLTIRQARWELTLRRHSALNATATFWHFMGALWLYILLLLAACGQAISS